MSYNGPIEPGLLLVYKPRHRHARTLVRVEEQDVLNPNLWWCGHEYQAHSVAGISYHPPSRVAVLEDELRDQSITLEEWEEIKEEQLRKEEEEIEQERIRRLRRR